MTNSAQPGWKKIIGGIGALALAGIGAYFGIDLSGKDTGAKDTSAKEASSSSPAASSAAHKPSKPSHQSKPSKSATSPKSGSGQCPVDTLPKEADDAIDRILTNQPSLYGSDDGKHFGNFENRLPREKNSYYREYTVTTPGLNHRGERRIVVGGGTKTDPDVWYYTDDHFDTFCTIPDAEK